MANIILRFIFHTNGIFVLFSGKNYRLSKNNNKPIHQGNTHGTSQ